MNKDLSKIEEVLFNGNLSSLTPAERVQYVNKVCESVGLNPLTKPLEYISLGGKLTLYAKKDATDQLRKVHNIAISRVETQTFDGIFHVTAYASTPDGRTDCDIGAVSIKGLTGEKLANTIMKAHTKAKRRVTLSICGLGILDESEVSSIPVPQVWKEAEVINEDPKALPHETGEVATPEQLDRLDDLILMNLVEKAAYDKWLKKARVDSFKKMTSYQIKKCIELLEEKIGEQ